MSFLTNFYSIWKKNGTKIRIKEIKLPLSVDDMIIIYKTDTEIIISVKKILKAPIKKLLQLIVRLAKLQNIKVNCIPIY